ncbi:C1q-related factor-like [Argopecten irradians]|uniref:C1q-related factor-like n=1 Tax=Argopecten irradians TaxID=31199 RepID=UPI0037211F9C
MAFHVILSKEMNNPSEDMIVNYDRLILNTEGANYDTAITGVYTCTEPGVYVFSWTIFLSGHENMYTDLVRNGNVIGSAQTGQDTRYTISGAAIAATELDIADKVWVRLGRHSGGADINPKLSMFTGFRI